jgi:hypothetical protein
MSSPEPAIRTVIDLTQPPQPPDGSANIEWVRQLTVRDRAILENAIRGVGDELGWWLEDNVMMDVLMLLHREGRIEEPQSTLVGTHPNQGFHLFPRGRHLKMVQIMHGGAFRHWSCSACGCSRTNPEVPIYSDSSSWGLKTPIKQQLRALFTHPAESRLRIVQVNGQKQPGSWQCGYCACANAVELAHGATAEELANCNFDMSRIAGWLLDCLTVGRMTRCPQATDVPLERIFPSRFSFLSTVRFIDSNLLSGRPPVAGLQIS